MTASKSDRAGAAAVFRSRLYLFLVLSLYAAMASHAGEPEDAGYNMKPVDSLVESWMNKKVYPGGALRIYRHDKVIYERFFGPFTPRTTVYIASAAKWLCAATLMPLVDQGRIGLDDPISNFLPRFNGPCGAITLRQLLSHTSGFYPENMLNDRLNATRNIADYTDVMASTPFPDKPGTRFAYNGANLIVAGRIAEVITGKSYEQLFQENVAIPCRMMRTCEGLNLNFMNRDSGRNVYPDSDLDDYCNFVSMIYHLGKFEGKQVIPERLVREMEADQLHGARMPAHQLVTDARGLTHPCYGLCQWREFVDAGGNATLVSSPSYAGFYPWVDRGYDVYGVFVGYSTGGPPGFNPFLESTKLATLVRAAIDAAK